MKVLNRQDFKGFYMNTFSYFLSKIFYIEDELDKNDEFINWINRITFSNDELEIIKFVNTSEFDLDCTTYNDEDFSKNAILISISNQSIRINRVISSQI